MKLNIINQSSNIELTSYQIAFMESVLEISRIREDLPYRHHRFHRSEFIAKIFPNDFTLNLPIYLVNRGHFVKVKEYEESINENNFKEDIIYPDEKIYLNEDDLFKNDIKKENNDYSDKDNDRWRERRKDERRMIEKIKDQLNKELGVNREDKYKGKMLKTEITEALGIYYSNYSTIGVNFKQPAIFLNLEKISEITKDHNEFLYLTTKVLIHEICHYILDEEVYYKPRDEFYFWMEESMANCLTLNIIYNVFNINIYGDYDDYYFYHKYERDFIYYLGKHNINQFKELFDYSKEFIISQQKNYQLGYYLFMFGQTRHFDFSGQWARYKEKLSNYRNKEKQEWLDYVKYDIIKDNGSKLSIFYNKLFDGLHKVSLDDINKEIEANENKNIINYNWADEL